MKKKKRTGVTRRDFLGAVAGSAALLTVPSLSPGQMMRHGEGMMGRGMMGDEMMGGGMMGPEVSIPDTLPKPNQEWLKRLRNVLDLEKLSKRQYENDSAKYHVNMPYMMVEPQEDYHVSRITGLFDAYKVPPKGETLSIKKSNSLDEAYRIAVDLESDLIPRYEWLINKSDNKTTKQVLDTILLQTRMHLTMFTHALRMGGMMGGMGMNHR